MIALLFLLLPTANAAWANSSDGIHTFLTADNHIAVANITADSMHNVDLVWSASHHASYVDAYHAATPATVVSFYIQFARDIEHRKAAGLAWYQKNRPSWVLCPSTIAVCVLSPHVPESHFAFPTFVLQTPAIASPLHGASTPESLPR